MICTVDCVHCYLKQAVSCMQHADVDEDRQHEVLYSLMNDIKDYDRKLSPARNSSYAVLETYRLINNGDPYKAVKKKSNDMALGLLPRLREMAGQTNGDNKEDHQDRLLSAIKVSVAGNVIDLGIQRSFDINAALGQAFETGFAPSLNHYKRFKEILDKTQEVLFLGDNAGEIVFDRVLVDELVNIGKKVYYVVKSTPVLNDSTIEDAYYTGMDKSATKVLENGSQYMGTCIDDISEEVLELIRNTPLIISKGQANFETLNDETIVKGKGFFLLKLKCESVAEVAGGKMGDIVFFSR